MAEVLVTGGSGYIGSWCVLALLNAGHSVRTTVRNRSREPELRTMLQRVGTAPDAPLRVLTADLTRDAGWPEAVRGCDAVLHVASPTLTSAPRSDDEMVKPARDGVLRVLRAARDAGVRRVVLTSAIGAIAYGHPARTTPFTEDDWTDVDAGVEPYQKSDRACRTTGIRGPGLHRSRRARTVLGVDARRNHPHRDRHLLRDRTRPPTAGHRARPGLQAAAMA